MSHRRFTVVHRQEFLDKLTVLWLEDPSIQRILDELETVFRTIPDQAGRPFVHQEVELWYISHGPLEIIYRISEADCLVQLISIRRS